MGLFSYIQRIEDNTIYLPKNIRAYFGWKDGLKLYVTSLNYTGSVENLANELIITTIAPRIRRDLWRLRISFKDRKGLIKELTELLTVHDIDIVSCKVSTVDQNKFLNLELEIDIGLYSNEFDKDTIIRSKNKYTYLDELKSIIISEFIEDVLFVPSDKLRPMVQIKRNLPLYRSAENLKRRSEREITSGSLKIDDKQLNDIKQIFFKHYPKLIDKKGINIKPLASVVADLESYLVRVFIFYPNTGYLHVRIESLNKVGALSAISKILNDCEININQLFNRPIGNGDFALTDVFIHYTDINNQLDDTKLKDLIRKRFEKSESKKEYKLHVIFPRLDEITK